MKIIGRESRWKRRIDHKRGIRMFYICQGKYHACRRKSSKVFSMLFGNTISHDERKL